ncbi:hypothetical protein BpHYR1_051955 [Brachionus plicatilis]|uniref:Uncharacterized protein n=1 Tax=Brachionus plicatilis TaxID=10195 RepID=A0A3M7SG72_BRAPC|nr:hypothetical protein BpHYR1_051955 [Brachionus plicatilis]
MRVESIYLFFEGNFFCFSSDLITFIEINNKNIGLRNKFTSLNQYYKIYKSCNKRLLIFLFPISFLQQKWHQLFDLVSVMQKAIDRLIKKYFRN